MNKIALAFLLPLITCTHLSAAEFQLKSSDITANKRYEPGIFAFNPKAVPGVHIEDLRMD